MKEECNKTKKVDIGGNLSKNSKKNMMIMSTSSPLTIKENFSVMELIQA